MSEYFTQLNYSLSNEDTFLETQILPPHTNHVYCVAGSGSRVLPLLSKFPKKLSVVDYSFEQLALTALRLETVKHLSYPEFLAFWGYPSDQLMQRNDRLDWLDSFDLSKQQKTYLSELIQGHERLIYAGRYEKTLKFFSRIIQKVLGSHINKMKSLENYEDFSSYFYQDFPQARWRFLVKTLGNTTLLNTLLYKGSHPIKNINLSFSSYFEQVFNALFRFLAPRQSFFLQMLFFGEIIDLKGAPIEADPEVFEQIKQGIKTCEIRFYQGDFFSICDSLPEKIDFISFSDILSYFPDDLGEVYMQRIKSNLSPKALTVHRYYFHITKNMDTTGYEKVTSKYLPLISREKTQIYLVDVYERQ